jgi:hypothetical protein
MTDVALRLEDLAPEDRTSLPYNHPLLDDYAVRMAKEHGIDPSVVLAIKNAGERSGSKSVSSAKARGVMQTIPSTQKEMGVEDPTDPMQSIMGGAKYLAQISKKLGTTDPMVIAAAYHAGPSSKPATGNFDGSPVTKAYAQRVSSHVSRNPYKDAAPSSSQVSSDVPTLPPGVSLDDLTDDDKAAFLASARKKDPMLDPTSGSSFGQNALEGVGKFFSDTGSGIRQIAANVANPITQALSGKDILPQDYEGERERKILDAPLMDTVGGNVGYVGAGAASLAIPGGVVSKFAGAGAAPIASAMTNPIARAAAARYLPVAATAGALSTLTPTTAPGERATNAAVSAALGPVMDKGGELIGRVARPAINWLGDRANLGPLLRKSFNATATPTERQAVARAVIEDVPVYPQQLDNPGSTLPKGKADAQSEALTRAMNSTHGSSSSDIPGALADSRQRLSDVYDSILNGRVIHLNTQSGPAPANGITSNGPASPSNFVQGLQDIRRNYLGAKPMSTPDTELLNTIDMAIAHANNSGTLTGRQFQNYLRDYAAGASRARKSGISNNVMTGAPDHEAADAYHQLIGALENQAMPSIPQWQQHAFRQANRQFRNMKTLEGLAPADISADFNPTTVARKLQRTPGMTFDQGDPTLQDLARFGATFMGMDANTGKQSLWQQGKKFAKTAAPYIATGLGEGAIIASGQGHNEDDGVLTKVAKASVLPLAVMGAAAAGRGSLNKRIGLSQLNEPRGALADLTRILQTSPGVAAAIAQQRDMGDREQ